jgi:hypothetical protein
MHREDKSSSFSSSIWLPVLLLACGLVLRAVKLRMGANDPFGNIAPWMALAFTGAIVFPRALRWWIWPAALLAVDFAVQGTTALANLQHIWLVYVCFAVAAIWGGSLRSRVGVVGTLARVIGCSVGFYLITNTQAWLVSAAYEKSLAGWIQALTTGVPGYPPTLVFLRNSLLSDLGFSLILLLAYNAEALLRRFELIPLVRRQAIATA